jgi:hypothetical protein
MTLPPPGWYPDPNEPTRQRYWNGERWTDDFAPHPPGYIAPPPPGSFAGPPAYFIPAQMGIRTAPFENARGLANATIVSLAITALLSIVSVFVYLDRASLISDLLGDAGSVSPSDVQSADDRVRTFALLGLASYVVTGIVFVVWFQRCYKNAQALGVSNLRFSSGWAAGAWFVPFLNLVRPKQIADDIWKGTDPDAPAMQNSSWMAARVPGLLHAWWGVLRRGRRSESRRRVAGQRLRLPVRAQNARPCLRRGRDRHRGRSDPCRARGPGDDGPTASSVRRTWASPHKPRGMCPASLSVVA